MEIQINDYLVLQTSSKPLVARCLSTKPLKALPEVKRGDKSLPVLLHKDDVLANLGNSPSPGSCFGVKIEPLYSEDPSKFFGSIRYYQQMDDKRKNKFKQELMTFIKAVKTKGFPVGQAELEVRPIQGKYSGHYTVRPTADRDIMCVRPNEALDDLQYILAHEYAHGLQARRVPKQVWASWVKMYHKYVTITAVLKSELEQLRVDAENQQSVASVLKDSSDETKLILKTCLKHIRSVHGLTVKHLDVILSAGETLDEIWPTYLELSHTDIVVTEYASKSPEEFFCEAFALIFTDRALPSSIEKLLDTTMRRLSK